MDERRMDPATQPNIDETILDYLVFTATKEIIANYERRDRDQGNAMSRDAESRLLQMVDSFVLMFRSMHPDQHCDTTVRFRLRLLSFAVLFTKRFAPMETMPSAPSLQKLREKRRKQASSFRAGDEVVVRLDLPDLTEYLALPDVLSIKQEHMSQSASRNLLDHSTTREESFIPPVSLLDTLPAFMALSAAQNAMQEITTITDRWMHLAAGYMAHAVAEQYLVYECTRPEALQEAFAWGFDAECSAEEGSDEWQTNVMFFGEDGVVDGWDSIRDEHMRALVPPEGTDLHEHLRALIEGDLSINKFEDYVLSFLIGLHQSQRRPLLTQVESGKIDGLSRKATWSLHQMIGMT